MSRQRNKRTGLNTTTNVSTISTINVNVNVTLQTSLDNYKWPPPNLDYEKNIRHVKSSLQNEYNVDHIPDLVIQSYLACTNNVPRHAAEAIRELLKWRLARQMYLNHLRTLWPRYLFLQLTRHCGNGTMGIFGQSKDCRLVIYEHIGSNMNLAYSKEYTVSEFVEMASIWCEAIQYAGVLNMPWTLQQKYHKIYTPLLYHFLESKLYPESVEKLGSHLNALFNISYWENNNYSNTSDDIHNLNTKYNACEEPNVILVLDWKDMILENIIANEHLCIACDTMINRYYPHLLYQIVHINILYPYYSYSYFVPTNKNNNNNNKTEDNDNNNINEKVEGEWISKNKKYTTKEELIEYRLKPFVKIWLRFKKKGIHSATLQKSILPELGSGSGSWQELFEKIEKEMDEKKEYLCPWEDEETFNKDIRSGMKSMGNDINSSGEGGGNKTPGSNTPGPGGSTESGTPATSTGRASDLRQKMKEYGRANRLSNTLTKGKKEEESKKREAETKKQQEDEKKKLEEEKRLHEEKEALIPSITTQEINQEAATRLLPLLSKIIDEPWIPKEYGGPAEHALIVHGREMFRNLVGISSDPIDIRYQNFNKEVVFVATEEPEHDEEISGSNATTNTNVTQSIETDHKEVTQSNSQTTSPIALKMPVYITMKEESNEKALRGNERHTIRTRAERGHRFSWEFTLEDVSKDNKILFGVIYHEEGTRGKVTPKTIRAEEEHYCGFFPIHGDFIAVTKGKIEFSFRNPAAQRRIVLQYKITQERMTVEEDMHVYLPVTEMDPSIISGARKTYTHRRTGSGGRPPRTGSASRSPRIAGNETTSGAAMHQRKQSKALLRAGDASDPNRAMSQPPPEQPGASSDGEQRAPDETNNYEFSSEDEDSIGDELDSGGQLLGIQRRRSQDNNKLLEEENSTREASASSNDNGPRRMKSRRLRNKKNATDNTGGNAANGTSSGENSRSSTPRAKKSESRKTRGTRGLNRMRTNSEIKKSANSPVDNNNTINNTKKINSNIKKAKTPDVSKPKDLTQGNPENDS